MCLFTLVFPFLDYDYNCDDDYDYDWILKVHQNYDGTMQSRFPGILSLFHSRFLLLPFYFGLDP